MPLSERFRIILFFFIEIHEGPQDLFSQRCSFLITFVTIFDAEQNGMVMLVCLQWHNLN